LRSARVVGTWQQDRTLVIAVRGELDIATAPLLRGVLDGVLARRPQQVRIDLSELEFLDSHGLAIRLVARRRLAGHGTDIDVHGRSAFVRRVFAWGEDRPEPR
jgi:anti-anti-sigma factor